MAYIPPVTGFEYTIVPDGNPPIPPTPPAPPPPQWWPEPGSQKPYEWASVTFRKAEPLVLNNFRIFLKYRVVTLQPGKPDDPLDGDTYLYEYPPWELTSQKLELTSRPKDTVFTRPDEECLFTADPGAYGTAVAGIKNGSEYGYPGVFDRTKTSFIERLEPWNSKPVHNEIVPTEPYDEKRGIYPIDTLTKFHPDTRQSVTLEYKLTTGFKVGKNKGTQSIKIIHVVYQQINNWTGTVQRIVDRAYFTHGRRPQLNKPDKYV